MPISNSVEYPSEDLEVAQYWRINYADAGVCTLCSNQGFIDTRNQPHGRINYCICPNGQHLRSEEFPLYSIKTK